MNRIIKSAAIATLGGLTLMSTVDPASAARVDRRDTTASTTSTTKGAATANNSRSSAAPLPAAQAFRSNERFILQPMYKVEAIGFTAVDETGWDLAGSDEIYVLWYSPSTLASTRVFGDVDSGESRTFHELQSCIYPMDAGDFVNGRDNVGWRCLDEGAPGPIEFVVNFYEDDSQYIPPICFQSGVESQPDCEDNFIGGSRARWTEAELLSGWPAPGDSREFTRRMNPCTGGDACGVGMWDADYDFRFRITRMEDKQVPLVPAAPAPGPIKATR